MWIIIVIFISYHLFTTCFFFCFRGVFQTHQQQPEDWVNFGRPGLSKHGERSVSQQTSDIFRHFSAVVAKTKSLQSFQVVHDEFSIPNSGCLASLSRDKFCLVRLPLKGFRCGFRAGCRGSRGSAGGSGVASGRFPWLKTSCPLAVPLSTALCCWGIQPGLVLALHACRQTSWSFSGLYLSIKL